MSVLWEQYNLKRTTQVRAITGKDMLQFFCWTCASAVIFWLFVKWHSWQAAARFMGW